MDIKLFSTGYRTFNWPYCCSNYSMRKEFKIFLVLIGLGVLTNSYAQDDEQRAFDTLKDQFVSMIQKSNAYDNLNKKLKKRLVFKKSNKKVADNSPSMDKKEEIQNETVENNTVVNDRAPSAVVNQAEKEKSEMGVNILKGKAFYENSAIKAHTKISLNTSTKTPGFKNHISALQINSTIDYNIDSNGWEAKVGHAITKDINAEVHTNNLGEKRYGVFWSMSY